MQKTDFSAHRVLVLGAKNHSISLLRSLLNLAGVGSLVHVEDPRRALELLSREHFSAVFCEPGLAAPDGRPFPIAARRGDAMLNPMIAIFVLQERARKRDVERARDDGVTDVLTMPVSPRTIITKLKAATVSPRPFIAATDFFGPDRRAGSRAPFQGSERRTRAPRKAKVNFSHI
jgi:CheY-like chemotaxis protein